MSFLKNLYKFIFTHAKKNLKNWINKFISFFFFTLKDSYGFVFLLKVLNYLEKLTKLSGEKADFQ